MNPIEKSTETWLWRFLIAFLLLGFGGLCVFNGVFGLVIGLVGMVGILTADMNQKRNQIAAAILLGYMFVSLFPPIGNSVLVYVTLLIGWLLFLARTVPQIHWDVGPLLIAGCVLLLLICGFIVFMLFAKPTTDRRRCFRFTVGILAGVALLFVSGLVVVGLGQSFLWLWELRQDPYAP